MARKALKALRLDRPSGEAAVEAIRHEVRTAREVVSPHVCRIFDLVAEEGGELVSMEFIDGITLYRLTREKGPWICRKRASSDSSFWLVWKPFIRQA